MTHSGLQKCIALHACRVGLALAAVGVAGIGASGCASDPTKGYSFRSTYPVDVRSVEVPIFKNSTPEPGQETLLTEAVIKELQRAGFRVTQDATADTTLAGVLTAIDLRRLSADRKTGLVQELDYRATVDFEWRDNRSGKVLQARRGFAASSSFAPARGAGEPIERGQHGAFDRLAKDLVDELRASW